MALHMVINRVVMNKQNLFKCYRRARGLGPPVNPFDKPMKTKLELHVFCGNTQMTASMFAYITG